jgi:hypothetical protein
MVKVKIITKETFFIELPIESFSEISFDNMKKEDSDRMIRRAIMEKYEFYPDEIIGVSQSK